MLPEIRELLRQGVSFGDIQAKLGISSKTLAKYKNEIETGTELIAVGNALPALVKKIGESRKNIEKDKEDTHKPLKKGAPASDSDVVQVFRDLTHAAAQELKDRLPELENDEIIEVVSLLGNLFKGAD